MPSSHKMTDHSKEGKEGDASGTPVMSSVEKLTTTSFQAGLEKASEQASKAQQHERDKKSSEAFRMYKHSLQTYLTIIEEMLFQCVHFQERNEDLLRAIAGSDKYHKPNQPEKKADVGVDGSDLRSHLCRLPGVLLLDLSKPVRWSHIIGHDTPKFVLKLAVLDRCPIKHPIMFTGRRKTLKSMLLFGPSGCGKSYLVKALCCQAKDWVCIDVNIATILNEAPLGAEHLYVKTLFKSARLTTWAVLALQDVHVLFLPPENLEDEPRYQRIRQCIVDEIKFINYTFTAEITIVVATTNAPQLLDAHFVAAFQKLIFFPLPRPDERLKIFKQHAGKLANNITDAHWIELVDKTSGYSGEDILSIVLRSTREHEELSYEVMAAKLEKLRPGNTAVAIQACYKFKEDYANTS